jgi:hypothetical protein
MTGNDMEQRVACEKCGASILPQTAKRTGGFCKPCSKKEERAKALEYKEEEGTENPLFYYKELFYKFREFNEFSIRGVRYNNLWCSSSKYFNDPFEFKYELARHPADIDALYEFWIQKYPQWRGQLARKAVPLMALEVLNDFKDSIGVCCFTKDATDRSMWAYYAANYSGFCLGFDLVHFDDPNYISPNRMYEVKYAPECPHFPISFFLNEKGALIKEAVPFLTTKHSHWSHEREWRYLHSKSNVAIAYVPQSLTKVIFGVNAKREDVQALREACDYGGAHPQFIEMFLAPRSYELCFREI